MQPCTSGVPVFILAAVLSGFPADEGRAQQPAAQESESTSVLPGEVMLGTVRLPTAVMADGERLEPGTYRLRLTADTADPEVPGQRASLQRWVEIMQGSTVRARAMATIIPGNEIGEVAEGNPPGPGERRVERLKGDEFVRIWVNARGHHVLLHLPLAQ
ncbi:MAG TPA: hypothetical protein VF198_03470 [Vicinamibacterales bacterium]